MSDPRSFPLIAVELTLGDGTVLSHTWTLDDPPPFSVKAWLMDPPPWLKNTRKTWEHPQDPITHYADVEPGYEDEARELLAVSA